MHLSLAEIATPLETPPPASGERRATGYSIDSRTIRPGELFFAVRGQRLDGHDFVMAALEKGAVGAVVATSRRENFPPQAQPKLLAVPDPLAALQNLAAAVRRRWGGPVVAITGSTGKTSTKQMIGALLRTRLRVLENEGNLNNQFGLPLSLLRLEPDTELGVFELAMSVPGEIRLLASLAQPNVGVVTNVSAVHLEFFPDVEAIARAKFELIEALGRKSWAVLNADDPRVAAFTPRCPGKVLTFGMDCPAHFRAQDLKQNNSWGYSFRLPGAALPAASLGGAWEGRTIPKIGGEKAGEVQLHLPLLGRHNVLNLLAALAVCHLFGIPASDLVEPVARLRPAAMRGETVRLANGAVVVNDCYNSNPQALEAMLATVAALPARRRFAVLGGMMELGPTAGELHVRCGRRVAELGYTALITVGDAARPLAAGARAAGLPEPALAHFDSPEEAADHLRTLLREGDVVLLKASRAVHLERLWDRLGVGNGE